MAIVVAPRISKQAASRLAEFAARYAPDVAVGAVDSYGFRAFNGPGLESLQAEPDARPAFEASASASSKNLFSALNQWLLKVLIAPDLPASLIGAPRGEYKNASALAAAADCSIMSAHRFVEQLRSEGFLDEDTRRLRLVRLLELFGRWSYAQPAGVSDIPLKMVIKRQLRANIDRYFPRGRACLGLFAAADELGVGFVSGVPPHVLVDSASVLPGGMDAMPASQELLAVANAEPDLIVRVARAKKSVFRGAVRPREALCCDVIQTWLDVSNHGARGAEQAEYIWRNHLGRPLGILQNE